MGSLSDVEMTIVASQRESVRTGSGLGTWQDQMRSAIRDSRELCAALGLPLSLVSAAETPAEEFPVFAPLDYVRRMQPGDPHDPLLRQVLPVAAETDSSGDPDPVGDMAATLRPGLLQKYDGRVLLVVTGACAVHCR